MRLRHLIPCLVMFLALLYVNNGGVEATSATSINCDWSQSDSYGVIEYDLLDQPDLTGKNIWVRSRSNIKSSYNLGIIVKDDCQELSVTDQQSGKWQWHSLKSAGQNYTTKGTFGAGSIKLVGLEAGVQVDKVMIADSDCAPEGEGSNCDSQQRELVIDYRGYTKLDSKKSYIGGVATISQTPDSNKNNIRLLRYIVDGNILQSSDSVRGLDTALLPDGKNVVYIETVLKDGKVIREYIEINTYNPSTIIRPLAIWFRNHPGIKLVVYTLIALAVVAVTTGLVFQLKKKKMLKDIMSGKFNEFK